MRARPDLRPDRPRAVTFDCWSTLIYERDPAAAAALRAAALCETLGRAGLEVAPEAAGAALDAAWRRHSELWTAGVASGATEMAGWALAELGVEDAAAAARLAPRLAEASRAGEIVALDGAGATLERLAAAGVRRALVCDTGFSPGRVVRELLARAGLLALLEVTIFSDEAGVPKPDPRVFHAALEPLAVAPAEAAHVGDLRRTDVAGARGVGMRSVRLRWHHDDRSPLPDADVVADSHAHLREILGA